MPAGISSMARMCSMLLSGVGFSNGWAAFMLKNPPPLVPRCLMLSRLATGPISSCCVRPPSSVWANTSVFKVWGTPCQTYTRASTKDSGSSTRHKIRTKSTQ